MVAFLLGCSSTPAEKTKHGFPVKVEQVINNLKSIDQARCAGLPPADGENYVCRRADGSWVWWRVPPHQGASRDEWAKRLGR